MEMFYKKKNLNPHLKIELYLIVDLEMVEFCMDPRPLCALAIRGPDARLEDASDFEFLFLFLHDHRCQVDLVIVFQFLKMINFK